MALLMQLMSNMVNVTLLEKALKQMGYGLDGRRVYAIRISVKLANMLTQLGYVVVLV